MMYWSDMMHRMDPWREMRRLRREINRLFNEFTPTTYNFPAMNIWNDSEKAVVTSEIPGIEKNDLKISVLGKSLTISGNRKPAELKENETCHRQERFHGKFSRTIELPFEVEPEKVSAKYKNGVLTITLPRKEEDKPRQIQIEA
jgi:HSP20 family protein